jgi:hypothetical protein
VILAPPPPFSEVFPSLLVGVTPKDASGLPKGVRTLVMCAVGEQWPAARFPNVYVVHCPLMDVEVWPDSDEQKDITRAVRAVRMSVFKRRRTLVCCHGGFNRSALIAALAIRQITGFGPATVITMIREKRDPFCLSNRVFEEIVKKSLPSRIPKIS